MYTTKLFLDDFVFRKLATELVGDVGTAGAGEKLNPIILVQYKRTDGEYSFRFQFQFGRFESKASRRSRSGGRTNYRKRMPEQERTRARKTEKRTGQSDQVRACQTLSTITH